jgi:hypothetical protein
MGRFASLGIGKLQLELAELALQRDDLLTQ